MKRNVYLEGELGELFAPKYSIAADSLPEILKCLDCNLQGFRGYFMDAIDKGLVYAIEVNGNDLESPEELLYTYEEGDVVITPLPAGSKSGGAKLLAGAAMLGALFIPGGAALVGMQLSQGAVGAAAAAGTAGATSIMGVASANMAAAAAAGTAARMGSMMAMSAALIGINLVMAGIQQMMAPDPSVDNQQDESYLFDGSKHNIVEGDPVPILYGELRVPGRPISFHTRNERTQYTNHSVRATSEEDNTNPGTRTPGPGGGGGGGSGPGREDVNIEMR